MNVKGISQAVVTLGYKLFINIIGFLALTLSWWPVGVSPPAGLFKEKS